MKFKANHADEEQLIVTATGSRPQILLRPFRAESNLAWDRTAKENRPATDGETAAYGELVRALGDSSDRAGSFLKRVQVTGRLNKHEGKRYSLDVRDFKLIHLPSIPEVVANGVLNSVSNGTSNRE